MSVVNPEYHFPISIGVGGIAALVAGVRLTTAVLAVTYAGTPGALIDLDHFLLARIHAGDWRALRAVLRDAPV